MNKNKQIGATNWPEEMSIQDKFSLNFQESGEKKKRCTKLEQTLKYGD